MTKQSQDKFMLRLPEGMRDRVAQSAKVNHRSMNAEIIFNLQRQFGAKETTGSGLDAVDPAVPSEGAAARAAP